METTEEFEEGVFRSMMVSMIGVHFTEEQARQLKYMIDALTRVDKNQ